MLCINESWFNTQNSRRSLLIGCESKWRIDCTVASCKRSIEDIKILNYSAYKEFCKADEEFNRYIEKI